MSAKPIRVFLTHPPEARANYYGERALAELRTVAEVRLNPNDRLLTPPEIVAAAQGCKIIISDRQTAGVAAIFDGLPDLVAFERVAVDIRNIDVQAASRNGVLVTRASPGFVPAVAEWIVGAMIDAGRHITHYTGAYRTGAAPPESRMGMQLRGSTIGIIGYGAIGNYLADLAVALGMRVLVHDPYKKVAPPLIPSNMPTLLAESDFIVPLTVANEETENLINTAALAHMKKTAWLINASRGNLVNEAALEWALDEKRIAGAVLDVGRAPDQMPSPHLAARSDVIATPHIAGLTPEAIEHQALETARQAAALIRGEVPVGAVNTEAASRLARLKK